MGGRMGRKERGSEGRVQERVREKRAGERRLQSCSAPCGQGGWSTRANPHTWGHVHTPLPSMGGCSSAFSVPWGSWELSGYKKRWVAPLSSPSERGERNREEPLWGRKGGQALAYILRGGQWRTQIRLFCSPLSDDSGGSFFCISCFSSHPTTRELFWQLRSYLV